MSIGHFPVQMVRNGKEKRNEDRSYMIYNEELNLMEGELLGGKIRVAIPTFSFGKTLSI